METKHTPGPWFVEHHEWLQKGHCAISSKDHGELAQVVWCMEDDECIGRNSPEKEANARLIAAAPELLEAAQKVLAWYEAEEDHSKEPDFYKRMDAIRAAIAKATGEA